MQYKFERKLGRVWDREKERRQGNGKDRVRMKRSYQYKTCFAYYNKYYRINSKFTSSLKSH